MVQRLMRIHVTEEARHIQFARDGVRKRVGDMPRLNRLWVSNINGVGGYFFQFLFSNKVQYRRVGLDARAARRMARRSPHRHDVQIAGFAPLAAFLEEVGLMGRISRRMWRRSHFLPSTTTAAAADAERRWAGEVLRRCCQPADRRRRSRGAGAAHRTLRSDRRQVPLARHGVRGAARRRPQATRGAAHGQWPNCRRAAHRAHAAGWLLGDAAWARRRSPDEQKSPTARRRRRRRHRRRSAAAVGRRRPTAGRPTLRRQASRSPTRPGKPPAHWTEASMPTSEEIHALPTPSVHPVKSP